jgi:hypothetical protein
VIYIVELYGRKGNSMGGKKRERRKPENEIKARSD